MTLMNIFLREEIKENLRKCPIQGCNGLPDRRLPEHMQVRDLIWCKPHAEIIAREISKRDYRDFVHDLKKLGVNEEPALTEGRLQAVQDRRCCVVGCTGDVVSGGSFAPY